MKPSVSVHEHDDGTYTAEENVLSAWRFWLREICRWGPRVTWRNLRFELGMAIGGFTRASNYTEEEMRNGEAQEIVDALIRTYDLIHQRRWHEVRNEYDHALFRYLDDLQGGDELDDD